MFSTFPGLHELLPAGHGVSDLDLFDAGGVARQGPGPDTALLRAAAGLEQRMAPADARFSMVIGCNRTTATGVALRDGEFEYEYSLQGDGTVPIELARLAGARHSYVECGHSDMPLADRVIAATVDLLATGATQRFAASPPVQRGALTRVRDAELREQYQGKIDWPHMTPEQRRLFLDTLNEAPRGRMHPAAAARGRSRPLNVRVLRRRRRQCARRGGRGRGAAWRAARAAPQRTSTSAWAASSATGCSIASSAATPAT